MRVAPITAALVVIATTVAGAEIPSSPRAREAIERVRPRLAAALAERGLVPGSPIYIRIFKQERDLELWVRGRSAYALFRTYPICTYSGDLGPKLKEGDGQSPEGFYSVAPRQLNPTSSFHLSFDLGFPNAYDRAHGRTGSYLMVHGACVSIGCYAMTDAAIEEIYAMADAALRAGQRQFPVHVFPFKPTDAVMAGHHASRWFEFWSDLKRGYDSFEMSREPPAVAVRGGRYVVERRANRAEP